MVGGFLSMGTFPNVGVLMILTLIPLLYKLFHYISQAGRFEGSL